MRTDTRILISGASIAGCCLAFWLRRYGFAPLVVEKAGAFRDGGQNVDVSGPAEKVVTLMGLDGAIRSRTTREAGLEFVRTDGRPAGVFPKGTATSFTRDIEILRGDLARVFFDATRDSVHYRFGRTIDRLGQSASEATVHFDDGASDRFDVVVSAEGIGSPTRRQVMGDRVDIAFLRVYTAYFRIPRSPSDTDWARWFAAPGGRVVVVRPGGPGTLSVAVSFWSDDGDIDARRPTDQRRLVREALAGLGWECPRIVAHLDHDPDFFFGPLAQVKARAWSSGRFVLVGDAACCPSPLTGMGTSLAILGAYVLAGEIARHADFAYAFRAYERILRPYAEKAQRLPPGAPRLAFPRTAAGVGLFNAATRVAASRPVQRLLALGAGGGGPVDDGFELPSYREHER